MSVETSTVESVLNLAEAMSNLDGDTELLQEIMEIFLETAEGQLAAIQSGIEAGDVKQVAVDAHGMKGGASNFCARNFVNCALKLEGAQELLDNMQEAFRELQEVATFINWDEVEKNWNN